MNDQLHSRELGEIRGLLFGIQASIQQGNINQANLEARVRKLEQGKAWFAGGVATLTAVGTYFVNHLVR